MESSGRLGRGVLTMNNQVSNATTTSTVDKVLHDDVAGMVDELFKNLIASCPVLLNIDSVQLKRIKQQWILGFQEQGVNNFEMVKCGMREARAKPNGYLPSVGEFIAWCKKNYNPHGLATEDQLYQRIVAFMAYGMEEIDRFKFDSDLERYLITGLYCKERANQWTDKDLRSEIQQELNRTAKRLDAGWKVPKPQPALPEKVIIPASKEQVSQHIANMRAMFKGVRVN